jgi:hypothetical protein
LHAAGIDTALDIESGGLEGLAEVVGLAESAAERVYGVALAALANARSAAAASAVAEGVDGEEAGNEIVEAFATAAEEQSAAEEQTAVDVPADPAAETAEEPPAPSSEENLETGEENGSDRTAAEEPTEA